MNNTQILKRSLAPPTSLPGMVRIGHVFSTYAGGANPICPNETNLHNFQCAVFSAPFWKNYRKASYSGECFLEVAMDGLQYISVLVSCRKLFEESQFRGPKRARTLLFHGASLGCNRVDTYQAIEMTQSDIFDAFSKSSKFGDISDINAICICTSFEHQSKNPRYIPFHYTGW